MKYQREYKINSGKEKGTPKISISIKVEGDIDKVLEKIASISDIFDTVNNTASKVVLENLDNYDKNFNTIRKYNMEIGADKRNIYYDLDDSLGSPIYPSSPIVEHVEDVYKEFIKAANEFLASDPNPNSEGYKDKLEELDKLYYRACTISIGYNSNWAEPIEAFVLAAKLNQMKCFYEDDLIYFD